MTLWPTVEQERSQSWRRLSIVMQIVLFVLTIAGIAALDWLADRLSLPRGWTTLIVSIVLAEFLILRLQFWRTGVEAALWIGGPFAFIFSLPSSGKPEAILAFVAAAALAGFRVRNALFGNLAFVLTAVYFAAKEWRWTASGFAVAVTLVALFALTRALRRVSTEELWEVAVIVMPVAAYAVLKSERGSEWRVIVLFVALAAIIGLTGIHYRLRVPLIACAVAAAIAVVEARELVPLSDEMRLILAGIIVLAIATALMRLLRNNTSGFVIGEPQKSEIEDVMTAAPALLPLGTPSAAPPRTGGGEFGGAGASSGF